MQKRNKIGKALVSFNRSTESEYWNDFLTCLGNLIVKKCYKRSRALTFKCVEVKNLNHYIITYHRLLMDGEYAEEHLQDIGMRAVNMLAGVKAFSKMNFFNLGHGMYVSAHIGDEEKHFMLDPVGIGTYSRKLLYGKSNLDDKEDLSPLKDLFNK